MTVTAIGAQIYFYPPGAWAQQGLLLHSSVGHFWPKPLCSVITQVERLQEGFSAKYVGFFFFSGDKPNGQHIGSINVMLKWRGDDWSDLKRAATSMCFILYSFRTAFQRRIPHSWDLNVVKSLFLRSLPLDLVSCSTGFMALSLVVNSLNSFVMVKAEPRCMWFPSLPSSLSLSPLLHRPL